MNPISQKLIAELQPISSYPWGHIQGWGTNSLPYIPTQRLPDFVQLLLVPVWPDMTAAFPGGTPQDFERFIEGVKQEQLALYEQICEAAKGNIIEFLNGI